MTMPNRYSIVGTQFTGGGESIVTFVASLKPGVPALLVREPGNQYDKNAIAVYVDGKKIGYVPKKQNAVLAQFIDQNGIVRDLAMDATLPTTERAIAATFVRSPNSNYPMVEV